MPINKVVALIASVVVCVCLGSFGIPRAHAAYDLTGWAWSSNIGWVSFNASNTDAGAPIYGLVAKYTFDNATGNDSSGNGYNGTLNGSPVFTTGVAGPQALILDGVNDYVLTTFTATLTDFTVCVWFKDDGVVNGHNERLLDKNYSSGMWLGRNANIPNSWGGGVRESAAPYGIFITLSDNAWHQLCSVRSGATHYIYGDGASVSTSNTVSTAALNTTQMAIGSSYAGSSLGGAQVDDVVVYNRALTVPEIQQLYQQKAGSYYSVRVATTTSPTVGLFSGYGWSPNVGWVSFNASDVTGCPSSESTYDKPVAQGGVGADLPTGVSSICTPRVDLFNGKVTGWARILSMVTEDAASGWLHLSGSNHVSGSGGVAYNPSSGDFSGYAWESSALGWLNFAASSPAPGVSLCVTGTSNCPPVNPGGVSVSCSKSPTGPIVSGNKVTFTAVASGGTAPYTYYWNGASGSNSINIPFTDDGFGPSVTVTDSASHTSTNVMCPSVDVEGVAGISSGLKLMITRNDEAPTTADYSDTSDYSALYKSLRVVSGQPFRLQWNIDRTVNYDECIYYPPAGFSFGGSTESGSAGNISTASVNTGTYTFSMTCSNATRSDPSSVKLYIVSSSVEEI